MRNITRTKNAEKSSKLVAFLHFRALFFGAIFPACIPEWEKTTFPGEKARTQIFYSQLVRSSTPEESSSWTLFSKPEVNPSQAEMFKV